MIAALQQRWRQARRRRWWSTLLLALPLALGATAVALRLGGFDIATVVLLVALLAGAALATWRSRQLDRRWLVRQLDRHAALQDSADLLFAPDDALNPCSVGSARMSTPRCRRERPTCARRGRAAPCWWPGWVRWC